MSDCDVCIGGWDGDPADCYYESNPIARSNKLKCCECGRGIEPGERYNRVFGDWGSYGKDVYRTCSICKEIRDVFSCGKGFMFEALWEDLEDYGFEHLTTASPCFTKLSAAAKAYTLERWRQWKFGRAA